MIPQILMNLDAGFLIGSVILAAIVLQRDLKEAHVVVRGAIVVAMISAYSQAMWLLGIWVPNAAGFPVPRIALDGAIFVAIAAIVLAPETTSQAMKAPQCERGLIHRLLHGLRLVR